ncbi:MAG: GNAT family N-acetyltransferase [Actinomycetota bacterium]
MTYQVEPLGGDHDLQSFDCGNDELTEWFIRFAGHATGQGTRTYVLVDEQTRRVVGYFAIAPHFVEREQVPRRIGRGAPRQIPAILLAKLALDRRVQGLGLGSELLVRALERIVELARLVGGKLVVVDAIDEAAARFYERHDFDVVEGNPSRLVKKLSTVAAVVGLPWP